MNNKRKGGFWRAFTSNVIKWWQLVILPVLHINNDRRSLGDKKGEKAESIHEESRQAATVWTDRTTEVSKENVPNLDDVPDLQESNVRGENISSDLARKRAEQMQREAEERRQREIEELRKQREEQEQIESIMNANKVDVNAFIAAGKTAKEEEKKQEELQRAQEIIERLNREAAEEEEKKRKEIEEARKKAEENFH